MRGIPNFLSSLRLGFVPVLLMLAFAGQTQIFVICLSISLITDGLDGFIARRFRLESKIGARLDSAADMATMLAIPPSAWWLRPEVLKAEAPAILVALLFYFAANAAALIKYRRLPSYHTWLAKGAAVVASVGFVIIFAGGPGWILRLIAPVVGLTCTEEIAMTMILPVWCADVPSVWHALRIKRKTTRLTPATAAR